jgi:type III secretion protein Q
MMTHQTSNYLLQLQSITSNDAYAANRLGRGMVMQYETSDDQAGSLLLRHSPTRSMSYDWIAIQTSVGIIHLEKQKAESLLNLFSSVPFVLHEQLQVEETAWHTTLYNHYLHPDFRHLFGDVTPIQSPIDTNNLYELTWQQGELSGTIQIRMDNTSLEAILERAVWHHHSSPDLSALQFSAPVFLGQLRLTARSYRHLIPGDILLPTPTLFSPTGEGTITLANYQLQINYHPQGTQPAYDVTHIKKIGPDHTTMNNEYDNTEDILFSENAPSLFDENEDSSPDESADSSLDEDDIESSIHLSDTPVTLKLQAGQVTMTLQELQQIHVGSVLVASGEAAGCATLYHGQYPIARGELVDVEGRLGIQLTSVSFPSQKGQ